MTDPTIRKVYQGILLAARATGIGPTFKAEGPAFHNAFGRIIEVMQSRGFVHPLSRAYRDPVFGAFHEAERMLVSGMSDLLITLDGPSLTVARFTMTEEVAKSELMEIFDTNDYELADYVAFGEAFRP